MSRTLVKNLLRVLVSGVLLIVLARSLNWTQVGQDFASLRLELWLAALGLLLVTQLISAARWRIFIEALGVCPSFWECAGFYYIGMYFNLILPTAVGGDVVRAWYLQRRMGRRLPAFLSVLIDRLSGLVVLIALASVAAVLSPVPLPWWVALSVAAAAAGAVAGLTFLPFLARHRFLGERYANLGGQLRISLALLGQPAPVLLSVLVQVANVVVVWLVGLGIGLQIPAGYYCILVPMVSLVTMLPVSINGMGVREGATLLFLQPLGISASTAVSLSFLWFCVVTAAGLCGGAVYLFGRFSRPEVSADGGTIRYHSDQGRTGQSQAAA